jgi:hypothetical protein
LGQPALVQQFTSLKRWNNILNATAKSASADIRLKGKVYHICK